MASSRDILRRGRGITCRELSELVTDYLEGSLDAPDRARFEAHLLACRHCLAHLHQMRETIRLTGAVDVEELDPRVRDELLDAFRAWRRSDR